MVLVELKARFDEENNIEWSRRLEEAGCTVIYGLDGYKVHSKLCLITKKTNGKIEYYTQIGTGNYNEKTARQSADTLSLMTYDQEIGEEAASNLPGIIYGRNRSGSWSKLLVAPRLSSEPSACHDRGGDSCMQREAEERHISAVKMNSLTDKQHDGQA